MENSVINVGILMQMFSSIRTHLKIHWVFYVKFSKVLVPKKRGKKLEIVPENNIRKRFKFAKKYFVRFQN